MSNVKLLEKINVLEVDGQEVVDYGLSVLSDLLGFKVEIEHNYEEARGYEPGNGYYMTFVNENYIDVEEKMEEIGLNYNQVKNDIVKIGIQHFFEQEPISYEIIYKENPFDECGILKYVFFLREGSVAEKWNSFIIYNKLNR